MSDTLNELELKEALERLEQYNKRTESAQALRGCGLCIGGLLLFIDIIFVHSALVWLLL